MRKCSRIIRRIKLSIAATLMSFMIGAAVMGASVCLFDTKLKAYEIPRSMSEKHIPLTNNDGTMWYIFLAIGAGILIPLGRYVICTLNECEIHLEKLEQN